jgi:ribosomal protein L29
MGINHRSETGQPAVTAVVHAAGYARRLVEGEARRSGQPLKAAARSVARRLKTSPGSVWSLLFRPPKQVSADLLFALEGAVDREITREIEALQHELATLRQKGRRVNPRTIGEVEAGIARLKTILHGERS